MNMIKTFCITTAIVAAPSLYAQTANEIKSQPYGDNPNIFRVLAYKTGEKIQNTAEKVGAATEKGIHKIKPKVDKTWDNTKNYTTEQAEIAKDTTRKGIDTAVKKVNETKDVLIGTSGGSVPIQRNHLSQTSSSEDTTIPAKNAVTAPTITQQAPPNNNNSSKQAMMQDGVSADIPR
ncbi:hypothetical protein [Acinetobacter sp. ANC 4648]|uniref:hypothetical protein n=1 Tax=Acinetobacter sp. ANC 4648 TaxID=1977875 RepID=UPI000A335228|nr:hypothetical protein [Acinetobacter sp. ANC 4648]OTG80655.1 hypothetical protein B9T27_12345 [Acinetobacter sp. ANC 4648]